MTDISQKALELIKKENIHPKPRWQFLLKGYLIWTMAVISVLLGSLSVSVALSIIYDYDLSILGRLDSNVYEHVILNLPYFWIVFIIMFCGTALYNFKHTKGGYKRRAGWMLAGSIVASLFIGTILFYAGAGANIDNAFAKNFPYYGRMVCGRSAFWMSPESGFLAGRIAKVISRENFEFIDLDDNKWKVIGQNIIWKHNLEPAAGLKIRMIGEAKKDVFTAVQIVPFMGQGRMMDGSCGMGARFLK